MSIILSTPVYNGGYNSWLKRYNERLDRYNRYDKLYNKDIIKKFIIDIMED